MLETEKSDKQKVKLTLVPSVVKVTQKNLFFNVAKGLEAQGVEVIHGQRGGVSRTKNVACWGWRQGQMYQARGHNVLIFERAYLGDRFYWTSIGWNGLNGYANFCLPNHVTPDRFEKNFELKPWKYDGDIIIIMGQVRGDKSLKGKDMTSFYEKNAKALEAKYKKKVYFRPHPAGAYRNFKPNIPNINGDLNDALKRAYLVVTYNSNSAVDAVVNGIPALSFDKGSMAYGVTGHTIEERIFPDREEWAHRLAHCQWTPDEITAGVYWENIKSGAI